MTIQEAIEYFETHQPFFGAHVLAVEALRAQQEVLAPIDPYEGLKRKYIVRKSDNGEYVDNCFVLRPDKDKAAITALRAYAKATDNKTLASDIVNWVGSEEDDPLTIEELYVCRKANVPVWVIAPLTNGELSGWACLGISGAVSPKFALWYEAYGKDWTAYRHPPKRRGDL